LYFLQANHLVNLLSLDLTSVTFVVELNTLHDHVFVFSCSASSWFVFVGITAKKEHVPQPETQALMDLLQQKAPVLTVVLRAGSLHVSIPYASGRSHTDDNRYVTSDEEVRKHSTTILEYK